MGVHFPFYIFHLRWKIKMTVCTRRLIGETNQSRPLVRISCLLACIFIVLRRACLKRAPASGRGPVCLRLRLLWTCGSDCQALKRRIRLARSKYNDDDDDRKN